MTNSTNGAVPESATCPVNAAASAGEGLRDIELVIGVFLSEQQVLPSTRRSYGWAVRRFFRWCTETGRPFGGLRRPDIVSYMEALTQAGCTPRTVEAYVTVVRRFYGWLSSHGRYPNIAQGIRRPRHMRDTFVKMHLDRRERTALLEYARGRGARDYAIVNLMLRNGLRTVEVSRLDVGDITTRRGVRVLRLWRKGSVSKDGYSVLTDEAYLPIESYLASRGGAPDASPLFATDGKGHRMGRMSPRRIQQIVSEGLDAIGLSSREYSPHSLRHTTAVAILEGGGTIHDVQTVLGHASSDTSQIYVKSIEERRRLEKPPEAILKDAFGM